MKRPGHCEGSLANKPKLCISGVVDKHKKFSQRLSELRLEQRTKGWGWLTACRKVLQRATHIQALGGFFFILYTLKVSVYLYVQKESIETFFLFRKYAMNAKKSSKSWWLNCSVPKNMTRMLENQVYSPHGNPPCHRLFIIKHVCVTCQM